MNFKIDTLIKMGKSHNLHCEDDFLVIDNDNFIVDAVFDGCSSVIDSHYASTRHKYMLRGVISHLQVTQMGLKVFIPKYDSHVEEYPKKVFFNTKELPEKYHKWNMERLYNVMTKGKLPELNDEGISNIDGLTIIKIKCYEAD